MGYSKYISSGNTSGIGGFTLTVSNPGNSSFSWLADGHIKIYLSDANQSLAAFQTALNEGTVALFNPSDGYTLVGTTLTFSGLAASATYKFLIKRETPILTHFVNYQAGAPLTKTALDNSNKYALFRAQELEDRISESMMSLNAMKTAANITGDFVDTLSHQTISNKTFTNSASTFDGGDYTLPA